MRYAVAFTTYSWDDFVQRQFDRVCSRVKGGDVYVVADETNGPLAGMVAPNVVSTTQTDILNKDGLSAFVEQGEWGRKSLLWYNLDYLTYRFFSEHQEYDYCVTMDYDAVMNLDVDRLVASVAERGLDFVAHRTPESQDHRWMWRKPHQALYPASEIEGRILCVTIISRAASNYLQERRRTMAAEFQAGQIPFWPFCEVFMPMELKRGGFKIAELSEFDRTDQYGWRPAYRESATADRMPGGFLHPLLDDKRLLKSLIGDLYPFTDLLSRGSPVRRELQAYPFSSYRGYIVRELWKRLSNRVRRITGGVS